ncbi:MAG: nitrogenase iron-molybdenum cofactor biosynthesis protein NifN [Candidatus Dactylopiibacterium sp.]|nr:nitrogenase iron-molybdenum cofactor biosynthesis protein NifN [Candidatus Dactylopiibacterium sp.]
MPEILRRTKPLSVNPLKASATLGASLAFLGLRRAMPLMHGSQGCTAFGKVFFVRHFREPIPLQTTAMDHVATVMSADENVVEALSTLCAKSAPDLIGLATTGLAETQGSDVQRLIRRFRSEYPQFARVAVVPVATPDFSGSLETGFAAAVEATLATLLPHTRRAGLRARQVNVLANASLTPGDLEAIRAWCEAFGLAPVILPDLGDSLDGHLVEAGHTPLTLGGTPVEDIATMGESAATLVIGASVERAADLLRERSGVPDHRFDHLMGLDACDRFTATLAAIAGVPVPAGVERARAQLQDALVDAHFMTGFLRVAVAAEADLLAGMQGLLAGCGAEIVSAVCPTAAPVLRRLPLARIHVGDLQDLEREARAHAAQLVIGSAHAVQGAARLGLPILRAGFPVYDRLGAGARAWVGYRAARDALFEIANLILEHHHGPAPYRSFLREPEPARAQAHTGVVVRH